MQHWENHFSLPFSSFHFAQWNVLRRDGWGKGDITALKRDEKPHGCRVFITAPHHAVCDCRCVWMRKVSGGNGEEREQENLFSFIHAMIISHSPSEARLNWSMMKICTSRKRCWRRKPSVSIEWLKSVLRIHDRFKLCAVWRGKAVVEV